MSNTALIILLWVKVLFFAKKCWFLAKKKADVHEKVYFLKLHMCVYFRTKFQVSNLILTSFRQGGKQIAQHTTYGDCYVSMKTGNYC